MKNLKKKRLAAGLTQEELANKLLVSRYTIINWENGHSKPRAFLLERLSKILGVKK